MNDWFRDWTRRTDWLVLDTETTGMTGRDELVELCVLSYRGEVLLDTLIRPSRPIPREARDIHGITDAMVTHSPTWPQMAPLFEELTIDRQVLTFNAPFDERLIAQTYTATDHGQAPEHSGYNCVMQAYRRYRGVSRNHGLDWITIDLHLLDFYYKTRFSKVPLPRHRAWFDAWLTLRIIWEVGR